MLPSCSEKSRIADLLVCMQPPPALLRLASCSSHPQQHHNMALAKGRHLRLPRQADATPLTPPAACAAVSTTALLGSIAPSTQHHTVAPTHRTPSRAASPGAVQLASC